MNFEQATTAKQVDSHTYTIDFSPHWVIGTVPHGGYVTSCFMTVVRKHFDTTLKKQNQPHTISLHLDFLRRTQTGLGTFKVKDVKLGRQTSIVHVALFQDDREEVIGYFTNSNMKTEVGVDFNTGWNLKPEPLPITNFAALESNKDPNWGERHKWPTAEFRKATENIRTWFPRKGQPSPTILNMWYCFKDPNSTFKNESLGFVADSFPQILEWYLLGGVDSYSLEFERTHSQEEQKRIIGNHAKMWYPTLLLNMEIKKALPDQGVRWLFVRLEAKAIRNGRYDLEVLVMDAEGDLVVVSNHVCFAVSAERNMAARRKVEKSDSKL